MPHLRLLPLAAGRLMGDGVRPEMPILSADDA
jgi:hypothetical protein